METIRLGDLLEEYGCDLSKRYLLKLDCEGQEKFLINDADAERAIYHAKHVGLEIHHSIHEDLLSWHDYNDWIRNKFSGRHSVAYHFSSKKAGCCHFILERLPEQPYESFKQFYREFYDPEIYG